MQPNNTDQQEELQQTVSQPPVSPSKNKIILFVVAGVVLVVGIIIALFIALGGSKTLSHGPAITVGGRPYEYACSVFITDTVVQALGLNADKSKQVADEVYAFAPFKTNVKEVDVLKETGRPSIPSTCNIKTDVVVKGGGSASFVAASATIQQYANEQDAKKEYDASKAQAGGSAKSLPSFADSSYYMRPEIGEDGLRQAQHVTLYKNMIIGYSMPARENDATGEASAAQVDVIHKDVIKHIETGAGHQPKNYTGITTVGDRTFIDACQSTDFGKIGQAIGADVDFDIALFTSSQQYAPTDNAGTTPLAAASVCNNYFRTKDDITAQSALSKEQTEAEDFVKYPHHFLIQVLTLKDSQSAQKMVSDFKKSGETVTKDSNIKISDVSLGDKAVKVFTPAAGNSPHDGYLHYIAKDNHVYVISILMLKQSKPYKTTSTGISDTQMRTIYEAMQEGAARAAK